MPWRSSRMRGVPGVFAGHQVDALQHLEHPQGDVLQVADGGGAEVEHGCASWRRPLRAGAVAGRRRSVHGLPGRQAGAHQARLVAQLGRDRPSPGLCPGAMAFLRRNSRAGRSSSSPSSPTPPPTTIISGSKVLVMFTRPIPSQLGQLLHRLQGARDVPAAPDAPPRPPSAAPAPAAPAARPPGPAPGPAPGRTRSAPEPGPTRTSPGSHGRRTGRAARRPARPVCPSSPAPPPAPRYTCPSRSRAPSDPGAQGQHHHVPETDGRPGHALRPHGGIGVVLQHHRASPAPPRRCRATGTSTSGRLGEVTTTPRVDVHGARAGQARRPHRRESSNSASARRRVASRAGQERLVPTPSRSAPPAEAPAWRRSGPPAPPRPWSPPHRLPAPRPWRLLGLPLQSGLSLFEVLRAAP